MSVIPTKQGKPSALSVSLGGNIVLAGLFLRALLNPLAHAAFITQTGLWLFLVEFLSIFVAGAGRSGSRFRRVGDVVSGAAGFLVVAAFAMLFGWGFLGNIYLPLIFLGSTLTKIAGRKAAEDNSSLAFSIPLLLGSLVIVFFVLGPELLVRLFPFPEDFNQYAPADWVEKHERGDISGEFVDRPQTLLAWGVIYYSLSAAVELAFFLRARRRGKRAR